MGTGAELTVGQALLASAIMTGAGTYMQYQSAEDANNERKSIMSAAQEAESKLNEKRAAEVENFAQQTLTAPDRAARYEKAATTREGDLVKALKDASSGEGDAGGYGKVSEDFTRSKAASSVAAADDIMKRVRAASRTSAAGGMYDDEALLGSDMLSNVAGITSKINREGNYARTALAGVNNSGSLVGGLMSGSAPLVAGMGRAPTPAPAPTTRRI